MKRRKYQKKLLTILLISIMSLPLSGGLAACGNAPAGTSSEEHKESGEKEKETPSGEASKGSEENQEEAKKDTEGKQNDTTKDTEDPKKTDSDEGEEDIISYDDPDFEEKLAKKKIKEAEKAFAAILNNPSFTFNGMVQDLMVAASVTENSVMAMLTTSQSEALAEYLATYVPPDYQKPDNILSVSYWKETHRSLVPSFADISKEWYIYANEISILSAGDIVTFSVKLEDIKESSVASINAYLSLGLPYSAAKILSDMDAVEPGVYSINDAKYYLCENGDIVRDNQSGARLFAATADYKLYDYQTGHFFYDTDSATQYDVYEYAKKHNDYYIAKANYFCDIVNSFSSYKTLSKKKFADSIAVCEVLRPGFERYEWGDIDKTYSIAAGYEYQCCSFYENRWITEFAPPTIHPSREVNYMPGKFEDMIECTTMSRDNNSYFEWDTQTCYQVNERIVELAKEHCTKQTKDELIAQLTALGVNEIPKERYMIVGNIWIGEVYVYTEVIDGEEYPKYDTYTVTWDVENINSNEDRLTLTVSYWFHTLYV